MIAIAILLMPARFTAITMQCYIQAPGIAVSWVKSQECIESITLIGWSVIFEVVKSIAPTVVFRHHLLCKLAHYLTPCTKLFHLTYTYLNPFGGDTQAPQPLHHIPVLPCWKLEKHN